MNAQPSLLAIPNLSEGHDAAAVQRVAGPRAPSAPLLDLHLDPDHNRSVLTFGGDADPLGEVVTGVVRRAARALDLRSHTGVHPRLGVVDVLPFVPYRAPLSEAVHLARRTAREVARDPGLPVYLYGGAHPQGRPLPEIRRAFDRGHPPDPDRGPRHPHPEAGVLCLGVRGPLVAFNVDLAGDLEAARNIARAVREASGGLSGVRALAFPLASRGLVQVSMNLTDPARTGPRAAFDAVDTAAETHGAAVVAAEVVGLLPDELAPETAGLPLRLPARTVGEAFADATRRS